MKKISMTDWLQEWIEVYEKSNIKLSTYCKYREIIRVHIDPFFTNEVLGAMTSEKLYRFMHSKMINGNRVTGKALCTNTINIIMQVLLGAMRKAFSVGYLKKDIAKEVKTVKVISESVEAFKVFEQKKLEKYIINTDKQKFVGVLVCLYTGLRIGEVISLKWENVHFNRAIISVLETTSRIKTESGYINYTDYPKTISSIREIPMPKCLLDLLKKLKSQSESPFVVTNRSGKQIDIRSMQYRFKSLLQKARLRELSFHSLRHTFATRAIESGMDVKTLAEVMGHSNPMITMKIYVKIQDVHKRKMMNKLSFYEKVSNN